MGGTNGTEGSSPGVEESERGPDGSGGGAMDEGAEGADGGALEEAGPDGGPLARSARGAVGMPF